MLSFVPRQKPSGFGKFTGLLTLLTRLLSLLIRLLGLRLRRGWRLWLPRLSRPWRNASGGRQWLLPSHVR